MSRAVTPPAVPLSCACAGCTCCIATGDESDVPRRVRDEGAGELRRMRAAGSREPPARRRTRGAWRHALCRPARTGAVGPRAGAERTGGFASRCGPTSLRGAGESNGQSASRAARQVLRPPTRGARVQHPRGWSRRGAAEPRRLHLRHRRGGHYGLGTQVPLGAILRATVTDDEDPAVTPQRSRTS